MATSVQSLMPAAACYQCYGPLSPFELLQIALLRQTSLDTDPANDVSPQGLISQGACFSCGGLASTGQIMILVLLRQISGGSSGVQDLLDQGKCYACAGVSMYEVLKLSLLAQISLIANPDNDVTPQALLDRAKCFECGTFASIGFLMELALFDQIAGDDPAPSDGDEILTEDGQPIETEDGEPLLIES